MALADVRVRNEEPSDKPVKLSDGSGMHLLVHPNSSKYWRLQYRFASKQKLLVLTHLRRKSPIRLSRAMCWLLGLLPETVMQATSTGERVLNSLINHVFPVIG